MADSESEKESKRVGSVTGYQLKVIAPEAAEPESEGSCTGTSRSVARRERVRTPIDATSSFGAFSAISFRLRLVIVHLEF